MTALTYETVPSMIGTELGVSDWAEVTQAQVDQFAACTGDDQWIHVDVDRAGRESPFGGTVAHGYLTLSLVASHSMQIGIAPEGTQAALNYGLDRVRFIAPVLVGARVRLRIKLLDFAPKDPGSYLMKTDNTLEIEGSNRPAFVAQCLALMVRGQV